MRCKGRCFTAIRFLVKFIFADMSRELNETIDFLKTFSISVPQIGIIMGTGLHQISSSINIHQAISYQDIPHFPVSTVESHKGNLLFGTINDVPVCYTILVKFRMKKQN